MDIAGVLAWLLRMDHPPIPFRSDPPPPSLPPLPPPPAPSHQPRPRLTHTAFAVRMSQFDKQRSASSHQTTHRLFVEAKPNLKASEETAYLAIALLGPTNDSYLAAFLLLFRRFFVQRIEADAETLKWLQTRKGDVDLRRLTLIEKETIIHTGRNLQVYSAPAVGEEQEAKKSVLSLIQRVWGESEEKRHPPLITFQLGGERGIFASTLRIMIVYLAPPTIVSQAAAMASTVPRALWRAWQTDPAPTTARLRQVVTSATAAASGASSAVNRALQQLASGSGEEDRRSLWAVVLAASGLLGGGGAGYAAWSYWTSRQILEVAQAEVEVFQQHGGAGARTPQQIIADASETLELIREDVVRTSLTQMTGEQVDPAFRPPLVIAVNSEVKLPSSSIASSDLNFLGVLPQSGIEDPLAPPPPPPPVLSAEEVGVGKESKNVGRIAHERFVVQHALAALAVTSDPEAEMKRWGLAPNPALPVRRSPEEWRRFFDSWARDWHTVEEMDSRAGVTDETWNLMIRAVEDYGMAVVLDGPNPTQRLSIYSVLPWSQTVIHTVDEPELVELMTVRAQAALSNESLRGALTSEQLRDLMERITGGRVLPQQQSQPQLPSSSQQQQQQQPPQQPRQVDILQSLSISPSGADSLLFFGLVGGTPFALRMILTLLQMQRSSGLILKHGSGSRPSRRQRRI